MWHNIADRMKNVFGENKEKALPKADTEKKQLSIKETLNYLGEKYIKVTKNEIILRGTDCYCRSEGLKWAVAKATMVVIGYIQLSAKIQTSFT